MWNVIYWGSLLFGSVLSQFFTRYWQSGHFKVWDRTKQTLKVSLLTSNILGTADKDSCCWSFGSYPILPRVYGVQSEE